MAMSRIAEHVGRVLGGRYRLLAPIGTGGSAHVYLAEDDTLRRRVAVKLLHPALAEDESFLRRFRAEAQAAAALNHPNVMRVYDWGEADDGPYLVLEYLGGGSLRDVLDSGQRLSVEQAASVGLQAARALDYAHRRGLVHRDIKPANLLFDDEGRVCIADFGVARALAEATWTEPVGAMVGTARYAAPEQAQGGSIDGKADVYALALVLIEAVTGAVPFQADTTLATLMARVDTPVVAPVEVGDLAPVIESAGRPAPADRPDAAALARDLDAVLRGLPEPEPLDLVGPSEQAAVPDDLTEIRKPRLYDREADHTELRPLETGPRRGRRWPVVLAVVMAVLALAGAAYAVTQAFTPAHRVPRLVGTGATLDQARKVAAANHFKLDVARRYDEAAGPDVVLAQRPAPGTMLKERRTLFVTVSKGAVPRAVPPLAGLDRAHADQALQAQGFRPSFVEASSETVPKGIVISWTPSDTQPKGATVTVTVSNGPPLVQIPDLTGQSFEDASKALTDAGFQVVRKDEFSDDVPDEGKVISTTPTGTAAKGTKVTVLVSKGPKTVKVPNLSGMSVQQAAGALHDAGLDLGQIYGPPSKRVFDSTPTAGSSVPRGTKVDVYTK